MHQKLLYSFALITLFPLRLLAWGHAGHAMVAELAMSMLSDATRVKIERVLGGMSAADAGNWMDEVQSDPKYKHTAPWHYTNIEPGGTYKPAPNGDIITALNKAYIELQHPEKLTPEQVKFDVLVLFHLCGDLMQPLHVGYGSDKGGNTSQVNYNGKGTNLHHIWDSEIIERQNITLVVLKGFNYRSDATIIQEQRRPVNFMDCLNEGRSLLPKVYKVNGHKVDDMYMVMNADAVQTQLRDAGMLLAACLEKLFSQVKNIPVATGSPVPASNRKTTPLVRLWPLQPVPSPRAKLLSTSAKR